MTWGLGVLLARAAEPDTDLATARLLYAVGDSRTGRTRLELAGRGGFTLESDVTSDRAPRRYSGTIPPERIRALLMRLAGFGLDEVEHVRKRAPGEPESRIELTIDGESAAASLWVSEVANVPPFHQATDELLALIRELSDGAVLEPGR